MRTVWEVAARTGEAHETVYDFGLRAQKERSVKTLWGDLGWGLYQALMEGDYPAYQELRQQDPKDKTTEQIMAYLLEERKAALENPGPLQDNKPYARACTAYDNATSFGIRFERDQLERQNGISFG